MNTGKTFTVKTSDKIEWLIHVGFLADDFATCKIINSPDTDDIGAGFSCNLASISAELRGLIEEKM